MAFYRYFRTYLKEMYCSLLLAVTSLKPKEEGEEGLANARFRIAKKLLK